MNTFPIALRIKFTKRIPTEIPATMIAEATEKADELYFLDKMDLYINFVDEYTTERYFSNQQAVDEWLVFIKDSSARHDLGISDIKIFEI